MQLIYDKKDFFYNNGLVNTFYIIKKSSSDQISIEEGDSNTKQKAIFNEKVTVSIENHRLIIEGEFKDIISLYKFLRGKYYESVF